MSAIAYELTYRIKVKRFSETELHRAYADVRERFGLPADDVKTVVAELETHTGLIESVAAASYEFSHLSLQEYLCGDYLVRDQFAGNLITYLAEYPAPVAIAVALSSNPSTWFSAVILKYGDAIPRSAVYGFMDRIMIERPFFVTSEYLGLSVMRLYAQFDDCTEIVVLLDRFAQLEVVRLSISRALPFFNTPAEPPDAATFVYFQLASNVSHGGPFPLPERGALPLGVLRHVRPTWKASGSAGA